MEEVGKTTPVRWSEKNAVEYEEISQMGPRAFCRPTPIGAMNASKNRCRPILGGRLISSKVGYTNKKKILRKAWSVRRKT
jgi:hypothetical protein